MTRTLFLSLDEALELHRVLLERFGGTGGIRDRGLLHSDLARPQTGYYATLWLQAAAMLQSLAMNHPFVDGNKRVAFAATAVFLRMNGQRLVATADDSEAFMLATVIQGRADIDVLATWLSTHARPA